MKFIGLCAAVFLLAASCSEPASTTAASVPDPQAASEVGPATMLPRTLPAPSANEPRFVGLWAASADGCTDPAWRFRADGVSTQGEVSCAFNRVRQTPTGYEVAATCMAEAPPAPYTIEFSFAESARAMMIGGGPWSATSLVYCGPLAGP